MTTIEILNTMTRFIYDALPEQPSLLMMILIGFAFWVTLQAQKPGNYWSPIFFDENAKVSALRVVILYTFAVSSGFFLWVATKTPNPAESQGLLFFFGVYIAFWSGAPLGMKFLEIVGAKILK